MIGYRTLGSDKEIKEEIKSLYQKLVAEGSSCLWNAAGGSGAVDEVKYLGYSEEEIGSIPKQALSGLGCGNPLAFADIAEGQVIVDLGCGTGPDLFLAAHKVGPTGRVIGIDMTERVLRSTREIAKQYGYQNIVLLLGEIGDLPLEDESVDAIISNCAINHTLSKSGSLREAYRVLKEGGKALLSIMAVEGNLNGYEKWCYEMWAGSKADFLQKTEYLDIMKQVGFNHISILKEIPFPKLGLKDNSDGTIKGILVKAEKSLTDRKRD